METYQAMRSFADSWGLLGMVVFFAGVVLYVFRPAAKVTSEEAKLIPFKEED